MKRPDDFHELSERLRIRGCLVTRTGLRIGSGREGADGATDLPVLRDAEGYPFIPGASIKGVLRSTIESLLRSAGDLQRDLWSCDPFAENACGHTNNIEEDDDSLNFDDHCAVCRLLGSQSLASHVRFSDALIRHRDGEAPVSVRDGVSIDRDLRRAMDGRLFDFEVINPGTEFDLEIFIDNPNAAGMGLLMIGFDQIADGFSALGGFTSRGLGRVEIFWEDIRRIEAATLLEGGDPVDITRADEIETQFSAWRNALAHHETGAA